MVLPSTLKIAIRDMKMDTYAIVTDKIINLLEQGVVPWRRPWTSAGLPRNLVSKKSYRGINHFLLSASKYAPFHLRGRMLAEFGTVSGYSFRDAWLAERGRFETAVSREVRACPKSAQN